MKRRVPKNSIEKINIMFINREWKLDIKFKTGETLRLDLAEFEKEFIQNQI